jgi:hypothetical protein
MSTPRSAALAVDPAAAADAFARDVRDGLLAVPKRLPPRWFYDALGSSLFEAICRLPWYRITRAEAALLARHAAPSPGTPAVRTRSSSWAVAAARSSPWCSMGSWAPAPLRRAPRRHLAARAGTLGAHAGSLSHLRMRVHEAPYLDGLRQATSVTPDGRRLVLFLGSNLGNFDPPDAAAFLREIAGLLAPGDALLLGLDLVKPTAALLAAYDDPLGVTAAFNKNVLQRMNAELGAPSCSTASPRGALARRGTAGGDAPGEPHGPGRRPSRARESGRCSGLASPSGRRAPTSTILPTSRGSVRWRGSRHCSAGPTRRPASR